MPSSCYQIPAPSGGLNGVDPIDSMDPNNALELVNILPTGLGAEVRRGLTRFATPASTQIGTIDGLALSSGTNKIIATTAGKIWSLSSGSATNITGSTVPTVLDWQTGTFGQKLFFVNGTDTPQVYDGSTVADTTFSGVTQANLINVSSYRERLYFVEKNTLKFWYGAVQGVSGALSSYDLKYYFHRGGYLLFAGSWTNRFGTSSTDLFFACSSEGEILFFQGSSPATDVNELPFSIVARFVIGKPLGYRAFIRVNADVWILTNQGIVPISALFSEDPFDAITRGIGRKINPLIATYAAALPFSHLWHGVHWPQGRCVYVLIPTNAMGGFLAVYNLDAPGWSTYRFGSTNMCAALGVVNETLYLGGEGKVYLAEDGYDDDGDTINFNGRLAFSWFGSPSQFKKYSEIRALMRTRAAAVTMQLGIDTNFQRSTTVDTIPLESGSSTFTPWGSAWGSAWSSDLEYLYQRHGLKGQGHSGAIRIAGSVRDAPLQFFGFDVRFNVGGEV